MSSEENNINNFLQSNYTDQSNHVGAKKEGDKYKVIYSKDPEVFGKELSEEGGGGEPTELVAKIDLQKSEIEAGEQILVSAKDSKGDPDKWKWSVVGRLSIVGPDDIEEINVKASEEQQDRDEIGSINLTISKGDKSDTTSKTILIKGAGGGGGTGEPILLTAISAVATEEDEGKTASMMIDENPDTRWSAPNINATATVNFQENVKLFTEVGIDTFWRDRGYKVRIGSKELTIPARSDLDPIVWFDIRSENLSGELIDIVGLGNDRSNYISIRTFIAKGITGPIPNRPPAINLIVNTNGKINEKITINASITDPDHNLKDVHWTQINETPKADFVVSEDKQTITFTPDELGTYNFEVTATDSEGLSTVASTKATITEQGQLKKKFTILSVADDDRTNDKKKVHAAMKKYMMDIEEIAPVVRIEHVGDIGYDKTAATYVQQHKEQWTPEEVERLWRVSRGNHDTNSSEDKQTQWILEHYFTRYLRNTLKEQDDDKYIDNIRNNLWIEAEVLEDYVYFINMDTEDLDKKFRRAQCEWVLSELDKATTLREQGKIKWIVVMCHKPFFTLKSSHDPELDIRFLYKEAFEKAQVDFVWHGHNHNYQATFPIKPNASDANAEGDLEFEYMPDGKTFDFSKKHAPIHDIHGDGGHEWNGVSDKNNPKWQFVKDSGKFGFTAAEFDMEIDLVTIRHIDYDGNVVFQYSCSRGSTGGGGDNPIARLDLPSTGQPNQKNVEASAKGSVGETVTITETTNEGIRLFDTADPLVKFFDIPDKDNFSIGMQTTAKIGTKQSIAQKAIQVASSGGGGGTEDLIWSSNIHGKWNNGQKRTVTDKEGNQGPNGGGFFTAASGNPIFIIDGDGTGHLEAGDGHGRIYVKAINYNSVLESDIMFEDENADNVSIKTRNRHGEGGACENRVGGPGISVSPSGEIKAKWEICHNNHEGSSSSNIAAVGTKKWWGLKYSVFDALDKKSITQVVEIDRKDGNGYKTVHTNKLNNPRSSYTNEALFMKESYFWLRVNNTKKTRIGFRNTTLKKINPR